MRTHLESHLTDRILGHTDTQAPTHRGRETRGELRGSEHHLVGSRGKELFRPLTHSHIRRHVHMYIRIHICTWHLKQIGSKGKEKRLGDKVLTSSCSKLEEVKLLRCFQLSFARQFQALWVLCPCQLDQQVV
jgi:hypothetical protein